MATSRSHFLVVCGVATSVIAAVVAYHLRPESVTFTQDLATTFAAVRQFLSGELLLLGPPSHFGGRHLGPIYYWLVAFGMFTGGGDTFRAIVWTALLNATIGSFTLFFLFRFLLPNRLCIPAVIGALLVLISGPYQWIFRDPWHSNCLFIPSTLFLLSIFFLIHRGLWALPIVILTSTLFVQFHFASAPMIIGSGIAGLFFAFRSRHTENHAPSLARRIQFLAIVLTLALWIPAFAYELWYPSNFSALLAAQDYSGQPLIGWAGSARGLFSFFFSTTPFDKFFPDSPFASPLLFLIGIFVAIPLLIDLRRSASRNERYSFIALFSAVPLYLLSLARLPAPFYNYYLNALLPLLPLLIGCLTAAAWDLFSRNQGQSIQGGRLTAVAFLLGLFFITSWSFVATWRSFNHHPVPSWLTYSSANGLAKTIANDNSEKLPVNIIAAGEGRILRESVLYFLPENTLSSFLHANSFLEMPSFQKPPPTDPMTPTYHLFCPVLDWKGRRRAANRIEKSWRVWYTFSKNACPVCEYCDLWRLERN